MKVQIGIGDSFKHNKEFWMIMNIKDDKFVCKNKNTGAVVEFNKEIVKSIINNG